jgi:hypothetical protein
MRVLSFADVRRLAAEAAKYPDRSTKRIIALAHVRRENLLCLQKEIGFKPKKRKSA